MKTKEEILKDNFFIAFRNSDLKKIDELSEQIKFFDHYVQSKIFSIFKEEKNLKALNKIIVHLNSDFYSNTNAHVLDLLENTNLSFYPNIKKRITFFLSHCYGEYDNFYKYPKLLKDLNIVYFINTFFTRMNSSYGLELNYKAISKLNIIPKFDDRHGNLIFKEFLNFDNTDVFLDYISKNIIFFPSILYKKLDKHTHPIVSLVKNKKNQNLKVLMDLDMFDAHWVDGKGRNLIYYANEASTVLALINCVDLAQQDNFKKTMLYYININFSDEHKIKLFDAFLKNIHSKSIKDIGILESDYRKYLLTLGFIHKQGVWELKEKLLFSRYYHNMNKLDNNINILNSVYQKLKLSNLVDFDVEPEIQTVHARRKKILL